MSDQVKKLINDLESEAKKMVDDLGGCAGATALIDMVTYWRSQEVKPEDLLSDFDSMLEGLINTRIRLGVAVENQCQALDDYEEAKKPTSRIIDYIKNSWKID
jgi:predicted metalloprotease with PDZ domain